MKKENMKQETRLSSIVSRLTCLSVLFCAATLLAAPAVKKDPVADGFLDWDGVTAKNWLFGRQISPSDLRHRVVVYVAIDGQKLSRDMMCDLEGLLQYGQVPNSHLTQWETQEMPRESILIISVMNSPKTLTPETFKSYLNPKDAADNDVRTLSSYKESFLPVYRDVKVAGAGEIPAEKMPYVVVYGGVDTEDYLSTKPLGTWSNYSYSHKNKFFNSKDPNSIGSICKKATRTLESALTWKRPLGVMEPKYYTKVIADFEKGKPAVGLLNALKGGIKDKNPDKAKEAQILFDAINQYKTELKLRIACEIGGAPARAYVDYQILVKLFPMEKKSLKAYEDKFKASKEIGTLGKILEKLMLWDREDFQCKNDGEAKKIVAELNKIKKMLAPLAEHKNAQIQGEAMVFTSQIDALIETIPTKVVQK